MSWRDVLYAEIKAIICNPVVMLTVFGGVLFYSLLYPLPYAKQTPLEQKVTIVNLDNSKLSYDLERMVDATPQVSIARRAHSIEQAKQQFLDGTVSGVLVIPEHFYKDLLLGKSPTLAYAGDASYFLVYGTIVEGLARAGGTIAAQAKVARLIMDGEPSVSAQSHYHSIDTNIKPVFNASMGYINYVVPAVFVLILQQTLIIGIGVVGASDKARHSPKQLLVRVTLFIAIYLILMGYYFGWSFHLYGIETHAQLFQLLLFAIPFLLSACLLGVCLGLWVPRREWVTVVVLMSSMPLVFSAGFIWPLESLPQPMIWLSNLFPSTPAIQGFLRLNQMGGEFEQVLQAYFLMLGQSVLWGGIMLVLRRFKGRAHQLA
ncbi:ABC transporter permease [Vibrio gallicus]|uniref:ABC transporter permease n=1 Tax=Vibrio gallicus TaxID=190897 RepID=UPI0021C406DB|nr:ABC transporter permease [Vibrio gallicus]